MLDQQAVDDLRERLDQTRRVPVASSTVGWEQGMALDWLRELLDDWRRYDTTNLQDRLDALKHRRVDVDGQQIHIVEGPAANADAVPLLLTHGWPGSFLEYLFALPQLSGTFNVVVPSLPGFGFSGPPPSAGLTGRAVASLWHRLMTEGLGHERFVAHGSDLGAGVTAWLSHDYPHCVERIHLATPGLLPVPGPRTSEEDLYAAAVEAWTAEEGGYAHEQATKPLTLGAALQESPSGLAAWIGEKIFAWSSTDPDGSPAFDRDLLLATLTLYWTTSTITSSLLPYWASRHVAGSALPVDAPSPVPTAISIFGGERVPFPKPPRVLAERYFTVAAWDEHDDGGHFPAVATPEMLAHALREHLQPTPSAADEA